MTAACNIGSVKAQALRSERMRPDSPVTSNRDTDCSMGRCLFPSVRASFQVFLCIMVILSTGIPTVNFDTLIRQRIYRFQQLSTLVL